MKFLLFPLAVLCVVFLSGCVEHQGYAAGLEALRAGDVSRCNNLTSEDQKKECYLTFADGSNDSRICLRAPDPTACVTDYASKRQQISACDTLPDPAQRYNCIARVTADYSGRSAEELIADWRSGGATKQCLNRCWSTEDSCKITCSINDRNPTPYERDGVIYHPVDPAYVECVEGCRTAVINCRDDCLSAGG